MDGIEATREIRNWEKENSPSKPKLPIIALTANAVKGAKDMFLSNGFDGFISKPIDVNDLNKTLIEWLPSEKIKLADQTPVNKETVWMETDSKPDMELINELKKIFFKSNQKKFAEIVKAIESNDIKLAHRLAHTLKGNAGQIGETLLQKAAADVERQLEDGENLVTSQQMSALETELNAVLSHLASDFPPPPEPDESSSGQMLDVKSTLELIEKLEPMLRMGSPDCLEFIDSLRLIPESEELICQIEDFDFGQAVVTLAELKIRLTHTVS